MLNKISKVGIALLLSIASLGLINNNVKGAETLTVDEEMELAVLFQEHLYGDENHYLNINDSDILEQKLSESNLNVTLNDVEVYVNDFNSKLSGEQGTEIQNEMLNTLNNFENEVNSYLNGDDGISTFSTANTVCSAAMTGVGLSNSAFISLGAVALGASGPAGWAAAGAALSTSALWSGGSLVAC